MMDTALTASGMKREKEGMVMESEGSVSPRFIHFPIGTVSAGERALPAPPCLLLGSWQPFVRSSRATT